MSQIRLTATGISKTFGGSRPIFKNISLHISDGEVIGITGINGSGKSTFLKILSGTLSPSSGSVELHLNNKKIEPEHFYRHIGFISPYLALYEEFTPAEHGEIISRMRGSTFKSEKCDELLETFGLLKRRDHQIRSFSSGMKQRVKYIMALLHSPEILFLDEPTTNFDAAGIAAVEHIIQAQASAGKCTIIATNDEHERAWCSRIIEIR